MLGPRILEAPPAVIFVMKRFVKPLRKEGHSDVWGHKSGYLGENMLPLSRKDILFYSVQEGRLSLGEEKKKKDCHLRLEEQQEGASVLYCCCLERVCNHWSSYS